MVTIEDASRANILSAAAVRTLKKDASAEEVDRCTQLLLDGLGHCGSSPWDGSRQSVLWNWMRDKVQVACETGDILVVGPDTSLSQVEREKLESTINKMSSSIRGEVIGTEGIWGVAHRTLPGFLPWEKNSTLTCGQYDDCLTAAEIDQRDTANRLSTELKARLMNCAGSSIKVSTFLNLLATDSDFRGLGLGKALVDTAAEEAIDKGSEMTWFTQTEQNEKMYARWGGECIDKQKLDVPNLVSVDESTQTWRVFVKRV